MVDDQENWQLALRVLLEGEGLQIKTAGTFEEAQTQLSHTQFDLTILDVRLLNEETTNIEGIALLKMVKHTSPSTKTIVLTGYPDSLRETPESDAFVFKVPAGGHFDSREFKRLVKRLLEN